MGWWRVAVDMRVDSERAFTCCWREGEEEDDEVR